jgi:hypothetical protein
MSSATTFTVFEDVQTTSIQPPATLHSPPTTPNSNSPPTASTASFSPSKHIGETFCRGCRKWKHKAEFYTTEIPKGKGRTPLAQVDSNALDSQQNVKLSTQCRTCREQKQARNKKATTTRRQQVDEAKLLDITVSTWEAEEVQTLFEHT